MPSLRFALLMITLLVGLPTSHAQQPPAPWAGGEFAAAIERAGALPADGRDAVLAQIAAAQGSSGEAVAAADTVAAITSTANRDQAIHGAGGGSFADFQSLIDLIQLTVVPDTWEALGGPSTMSQYPQGVYVDSQGTLQRCETIAHADAVTELKHALRRNDPTGDAADDHHPESWRSPAALRCVSLRRLLDQWTRLQIASHRLPEDMVHMAGLSHVQYVFVDGDDILIAGPVGGIDSDQGWYRDRQSGWNAIRLDFFVTSLAAALQRQPFGCTIDPTAENLQRAASVAADIRGNQIPLGKASEAMAAALGRQRVEVFGTAGDTAIGLLMVEADRHMKELALGVHPMPRGVPSYLDVIDATIADGPPDQLLLRLWFTAAPRAVRADAQRTVFELAGTPLRLSGQNERAVASGQRGLVTHDPRSEMFVHWFNQRWNDIRSQYPVYAALQSIYESASVAEVLQQHTTEPRQIGLLQALAANASSLSGSLPVPRQVESIAVSHTVRHGNQRHHVVVASGGVSIDSRQTLATTVADYPPLGSMAPRNSEPKVNDRWWWNARR